MKEIRRLVTEGYNHSEIQRQLHLAEKTYYRYYDACFAEDRTHMTQSITPTESLTQLAIVQERLNSLYRTMKSIADNQNIESESRIAAGNLAAELAVGVLKSWEDSPLGGLGILRRVEKEAEKNKQLPVSIVSEEENERKRIYQEQREEKERRRLREE